MAACLAPLSLSSQPAEGPDSQASALERLLATPVQVATVHAVPLRESPGVITLITREDIRESGARTLMDILKWVPGLDFASDTNTVIGLGVRSAWAHDGKVLLIVDGLEMNEPLYGTTQFGGHYPLAHVDHIEVIRGPGSAIYGGYAGLAVIRVTTRTAADLGGLEAEARVGRMPGSDQALAQGQLSWGRTWGAQDLVLSASRAMAPQGVGTYPVSFGLREAGEEGRTAETHLTVGWSWETLRVRYLHDAYSTLDYTRYSRPTTWMQFPSDLLGLDWSLTRGDWTFQPRLVFKHQRPWMFTDARTDRNTRGMASLLTTWTPAPTLRLSLGLEAIQDESSIFWSSLNRRETYVFQSRAALLQALWSPAFGNLDLGVRQDHSNAYGSATSPRLAYTRAEPGWHLKVLAAGAFRAPSIENLLVNPDLKPERTTTYEVEMGWALSRTTYLTANLYTLRVRDPISYASNPTGDGTYLNFNRTGAEGLEVQLKARRDQFSIDAALSLARARDREADFYQVEGHPNAHVGLAPLKASLQARWRVARGWSLNPGILFYGPRFGYRPGEVQTSRFGSTTLVDLGCTWQPGARIEGGLFLTNALDRNAPLLQAYGQPGTGGNAPLPGPGREISLRLTCRY